MVVCLEQDADLHMAQLMPLPLTVTCFSKIQIGFTFLVPAHLGSPGKRAVKRVCMHSDSSDSGGSCATRPILMSEFVVFDVCFISTVSDNAKMFYINTTVGT